MSGKWNDDKYVWEKEKKNVIIQLNSVQKWKLIELSRNILMLYQFQYNKTTDALSKPSIVFCALALFFSFIQPLFSLSYHLHHHQFRRPSLSLNFSLMVVWLLFSIFPHFVLRNISLAGIWCSDVCKTVVNPFYALLVVFFCTALVYLCCVIYAFPKKKKKAPSLARSREREPSLSIPIHRMCVCCECGGDGCENYCSERGEIVLFWKNVSALMWFPNCYYAFFCLFSCEKMQPQQILVSRYQVTLHNLAHPDTPRNRRRPPPGLQLDYHRQRKGLYCICDCAEVRSQAANDRTRVDPVIPRWSDSSDAVVLLLVIW